MNGRGLFDRYMDDNLSRFLNEAVEEVYDFYRKADDTSVPANVKTELIDYVNELTRCVFEEGYEFIDICDKLRKDDYKLITDKLSALERLNPKIIVKRVTDSDMVARKNVDDPWLAQNEEGIFTRLFNEKNLDKFRDHDKGYEISDEQFKDFLRSPGYGTGIHSAFFKNKNVKGENRGEYLVAVPDSFKTSNGKIDGRGNLTYYKYMDGGKIGDKITCSIGSFNKAYVKTDSTFKDEESGVTYNLFRKITSDDFRYAYFRDRDNEENKVPEKIVDTLTSKSKGTQQDWYGKREIARKKHTDMIGDRSPNPQIYPFTYADYFFVKNNNGIYSCVRIITAESKIRRAEKGEYHYNIQSNDIVYIEGYILETPPPSELETEGTVFYEKVIRYIDDIIKYISNSKSINVINNKNVNNKLLDPRTPDYKAFASDPIDKQWVKMDSQTNATTIMLNILTAFKAIDKFIGINPTNPEQRKHIPDNEMDLYMRANITLPGGNTAHRTTEHYERLITYLQDFQRFFYGGNWKKIEGIDKYENNPNLHLIIRQWGIRQLTILKILFKNDVFGKIGVNYLDNFKKLKEFEENNWKLIPTKDVYVTNNPTPEEDLAVMETIRRRLLEYCD